ncbi:MAG: PxxKW family cysteine-rich protein [Thermodesulfobacteriota bacterium]
MIKLVCKTVRNGKECPFMGAKGCSFNGGICHEIVEQCKGCNRSIEYSSTWYCTAYPNPPQRWKNGNCNMASHVVTAAAPETKVKVNPLKASKRAAK